MKGGKMKKERFIELTEKEKQNAGFGSYYGG